MSTLVKVSRYHLIQRFNYLELPWLILGFVFVVDLLILKLTPAGHTNLRFVGGLGSMVVLLFVLGLQSVAQALPFGLTLGASRRTFYLGTALLAVGIGVAMGLGVTVLQALERATGGWWISMGFFRVPYLLDGPWYQTWLTALVALTLAFVYGMWFGLVFRRWGLVGLVAFLAGQITVLVAGAIVTTWAHAWSSVGHFFTTLSATGLTGLLALVVVTLGVLGYGTMRHTAV
jgi:hypothetical protein